MCPGKTEPGKRPTPEAKGRTLPLSPAPLRGSLSPKCLVGPVPCPAHSRSHSARGHSALGRQTSGPTRGCPRPRQNPTAPHTRAHCWLVGGPARSLRPGEDEAVSPACGPGFPISSGPACRAPEHGRPSLPASSSRGTAAQPPVCGETAAVSSPEHQASPRPAPNAGLENNLCFPQITVLFPKKSVRTRQGPSPAPAIKRCPLLPATRPPGQLCSQTAASPTLFHEPAEGPAPPGLLPNPHPGEGVASSDLAPAPQGPSP